MNVFATSPAHVSARETRAEIDAIAAALRESPSSFDRKGVADRLGRAVRALYAVLDTSLDAPAHHDGLVECSRVLGEARQMLTGDHEPALLRARTALDAAHARVRRSADEIVDLLLARRGDLRLGRDESQKPSKPFRASRGVPRLHAMARARVAPPLTIDPSVPLAERKQKRKAPAKPQTLEELRAAAAAPGVVEPAAEPEEAKAEIARSEDGEIVRVVARDCLEDIASLSLLRTPIPTETWLEQAPFEQRLLDNLDAFVALGERALPSVTLFHAEAPAPDPSRGFAVAFTLGCVEGTDAAAVAVATMKQSAPEELPGFVEGFILASSPAIDAELEPLLDAPNPALAAAVLTILGARGTLPLDAPERVLPRRDPALTANLATALGRALPKAKALSVLSSLFDEPPDDALFAAACTSLLMRGDGAIRQRLRDTIRSRGARGATATRLLALAGREEDLAVLLEGLAIAPDARAIRALGRYGHVGALGALIALLDAKDEKIVAAAAEALDFITHAGLRETVDEPWAPGIEPPDGAPPAVRPVSKPLIDRLAWEKWYAATRGRLVPQVKLRAGAPFTPLAIVDELEGRGRGAGGAPDDPSASPAALRAEAALELTIATGTGQRFSTTDWVARQKEQLSSLRAQVRALGSTSGGFWYGGVAVTNR